MQPASSPKVSRPLLYSPVAVQLFAFILLPLFGGVMAHASLKNLGRQAAARRLLWECIFFTTTLLGVTSLLNNTVISNNMVATGLNMAGVLWLSRRYNRLAPEAHSLPHKSLWTPLLIGLLWSVVFGFPVLARLFFR